MLLLLNRFFILRVKKKPDVVKGVPSGGPVLEMTCANGVAQVYRTLMDHCG